MPFTSGQILTAAALNAAFSAKAETGNVYTKAEVDSLVAAGGGGGGSGPTITTPANITAAENGIFTLALTASEVCDWEIVADYEDGALFGIVGTNTGDQTFDFEAPADANADNIYKIKVRATSQSTGLSAEKTLTLSVTDVLEAAWSGTDKDANIILTNGRLTASASGYGAVRGNVGITSGTKSFKITVHPSGNAAIGVSNNVFDVNSDLDYLGSGPGSIACYQNGGAIFYNNASTSQTFSSPAWVDGDEYTVTVNATARTVVYSRLRGGVTETLSAIDISGMTGTIYPIWQSFGAGSIVADFTDWL